MTTVVFLIECGSCKTEIARDLIATALDTGVPRAWCGRMRCTAWTAACGGRLG